MKWTASFWRPSWSLRRRLVFPARTTDAPDYQTAAVIRGELTQVVTATGTLNPVVNVTVGSQVSGRISKLYVDYNSMVKSTR